MIHIVQSGQSKFVEKLMGGLLTKSKSYTIPLSFTNDSQDASYHET